MTGMQTTNVNALRLMLRTKLIGVGTAPTNTSRLPTNLNTLTKDDEIKAPAMPNRNVRFMVASAVCICSPLPRSNLANTANTDS